MAVGVDAFFLESYTSVETASLAIPFIRDAGVPAVVMLVYHDSEYTVEGYSPAEGAKFLEDQGADVVGVNCMRSWPTMRRIIRDIRKAVSIPVISQPVGYEMEPGEVYCHAIHGPQPTYPKVEPRSATRFAMAEYAREANAVGVNVVGGCCGTLPYHIRAMAETLGKTVALPDMDRGHGAPAAL
jgi:betaine-homocysteine S-methyltransferase